MLTEYRDEIHELKMQNAHFAKIFEKHNELDQKAKDADEGRLHLRGGSFCRLFLAVFVL